jgi:hypothetical protein
MYRIRTTSTTPRTYAVTTVPAGVPCDAERAARWAARWARRTAARTDAVACAAVTEWADGEWVETFSTVVYPGFVAD